MKKTAAMKVTVSKKGVAQYDFMTIHPGDTRRSPPFITYCPFCGDNIGEHVPLMTPF